MSLTINTNDLKFVGRLLAIGGVALLGAWGAARMAKTQDELGVSVALGTVGGGVYGAAITEYPREVTLVTGLFTAVFYIGKRRSDQITEENLRNDRRY